MTYTCKGSISESFWRNSALDPRLCRPRAPYSAQQLPLWGHLCGEGAPCGSRLDLPEPLDRAGDPRLGAVCCALQHVHPADAHGGFPQVRGRDSGVESCDCCAYGSERQYLQWYLIAGAQHKRARERLCKIDAGLLVHMYSASKHIAIW